MMGNGYTSAPSYLWVIPAVLVAVSATAIIGVAFYFVFPELRYVKASISCDPQKAEPIPTQMKETTGTTVTQRFSYCFSNPKCFNSFK